MARLWTEDEEELLMECLEDNMTLREITTLFESKGSDRTYKSIEYKRSKIKKTWAYEHDNGTVELKEKTIESKEESKEESIVDWLLITCVTIGAIIFSWWFVS
jgi:hypothetical protein